MKTLRQALTPDPTHKLNAPSPCAKGKFHVAIILGTYNGAAHLSEQLESLLAQSHEDWSLWAHDDGSTDNSWDILTEFAEVARRRGKRVTLARQQVSESKIAAQADPVGVARAYHWLISQAEVQAAPYVALCDQDDVWNEGRLAKGVAALAPFQSIGSAAMHSSGMTLIDDQGRDLGQTRPRSGRPTLPAKFASALARCPTNAPTLLFNAAAVQLAKAVAMPADMPTFDWWQVLLVLGCGGTLVQDRSHTVRYRQHRRNMLGEVATWRGIQRRAGLLTNGGYRRWRDSLAVGLKQAPLTPEARQIVEAYCSAPHAGIARANHLLASDLVRPGIIGKAATILCASTGAL
ncbi:MAG: glycosyltransferase [Pseudomonadota bacterium]